MKRYYIEEAKCGITKGGIACGPCSGNVVATARFNDGIESKWLSLVEVEGIPNYVLSVKDLFDALIEEKFDDEEFNAEVLEHNISEFNGISLDDYTDSFCSFREDPDNPAVPLIRYLIALARCPMEEVDGLISMAAGRYVDELEIPLSDEEEDYLAELEEEEEDDC